MRTYSPLLVYQQLVEVHACTTHNILIDMVRWSNAYDVGLRNRKMGVGIPRESPIANQNNYKKRRKDYDYY